MVRLESMVRGEFCRLIDGVLRGGLKDEFMRGLRGLDSRIRVACRAFLAANTLFGEGDIRVGELPEDLRRVVEEATSGTSPVGGVGWLVRTFLGVRALSPAGGGDAHVIRSGGVGEWVCREFLGVVDDLSGSSSRLEGGGRAEALITLSRCVSDSRSGNLRDVLAGVSRSLLRLLPGISGYATLAWVLRFAAIPSVREGLRGCGVKWVSALNALLKEFSPAVFDLSECRLYRGADGVPSKLLSRGDYLITSGSVVVRREGREGRDYVIYGEEVPASPIYAFLDAATEVWVRAEEVLFGTSPTLKTLESFVEANMRGVQPRLSARARKVIEVLLGGGGFKVVTVPGRDEFAPEDQALVLELTQVTPLGVLDVSVGWDGVMRGNAVINRYAVRFKPTYLLRASKRVRELVTSELLRSA